MKIGISSWACPWAIGVAGYPRLEPALRATDLLKLASLSGAEVLQIADNLPLNELSVQELQALASDATFCGIDLEVGTRGLNPENLHFYLDIATSLGARLVRTLPHNGTNRPELSEALHLLDAVKHRYEDAGVMLAIENHDFYPSAWLRRLVEEASSPNIGVCLDSVNNLGLGESFAEVLCNLGNLTINFHCKDYRIARKPTMLGFDVTGAPAGEGMLDLSAVHQKVWDDASWIIESWLPWQDDIKKTIRIEREWLIRGISNLKAWRVSADFSPHMSQE